MNGGDRRCRQERDRSRPLSVPGVKGRADPVAHFGCRAFGKRDGNDSQWIHPTSEKLEIHLDQLAGFAGPRAGPNDCIGLEWHVFDANHKDTKTQRKPASKPFGGRLSLCLRVFVVHINLRRADTTSGIRSPRTPAFRPDPDATFLYELFPSDRRFAREHHRKPPDPWGTTPLDCRANEAADTGLPLVHLRRRQERAAPDMHRSEPETTLLKFSRSRRKPPSI